VALGNPLRTGFDFDPGATAGQACNAALNARCPKSPGDYMRSGCRWRGCVRGH